MAAEKTEATVQETGVYSQENVTRRPSIFDDPDATSSNFHRTNATEFSLLKDGVGSIVLYRKYDFMLKITGDNEIDAEKVQDDIVYAIDHVLGVTKAQDVEKFDNFKEIDMNGKPTLIYTVFIPFSERQNLIVQNITRQVQLLNAKVENEGYKYVIRRKDMVKVLLDTNNGVSDKVFMKGILAASHEHAIIDRETDKVLCGERDHVRGNVYLDASIGLTRKEAFMFNRYNLSLLKFGVYGDEEDKGDHKVVEFFLPFKKKFFIEEFQIEQNDLGDGKKFKCTRAIIPVLLKMSKIVKMSETYVPTGIITIMKKSVIGIDTFDEIFLDENGKNVLVSKAEIDNSSFEMTTFNSELKTIEDQILSGIKNVEEEQEPIENRVTVQPEEEATSAKKSANSKKKKSEKATEKAEEEDGGMNECAVTVDDSDDTEPVPYDEDSGATTEAVENDSGNEVPENQSSSSEAE